MVRRCHGVLALRERQGACHDLCILAGASMRVEPQWQCTNCHTYNHHSQTYCLYCYELAPAAHTITPAKFGPDLTIEPPSGFEAFGVIDYGYTPNGKAALRGEFGELAKVATACHHGKTTPTFDEYRRLVWARRKDDSSINRG